MEFCVSANIFVHLFYVLIIYIARLRNLEVAKIASPNKLLGADPSENYKNAFEFLERKVS